MTTDDETASFRLGSVAFGYADQPAPPPSTEFPPSGCTFWGAFTPSGEMVAKAIDIHHHHWYGESLVPGAGIAGVAVAPEMRSQGLARLVLTGLLAGARERGALISTLYATIPVPYRRTGWEEAGALQTWRLPTASLATLTTPAGWIARAATAVDVPSMVELFRQTAATGPGTLDRDSFDLGDYHGASIAIDPDGVTSGFCLWDRSGGYGADGTLSVHLLIARSEPALTTLLAMIGSWSSVAPHTILDLAPDDPAFLLIPMTIGAPLSRRPWMLRVVDAPAAVAARNWPALVDGSADLLIEDPVCPWNSGTFRFTVSGGVGSLEPGGSATVRIGSRGLAALYAGASTPTILRRAGLLDGDTATDAFLQAATAGPPPTMRSYF